MRIVRAIKHEAGCLIEELGKDRFDRGDVRIKIEMFLLDVQDEGMFRFEKAQGAVALIAFRDEIFAARIPVRVRAEDRNLRADVMRRMAPALAQNVRRHRGSRGLAMHAGDDDSAFARHDRGQDTYAQSVARRQLPVFWANRVILAAWRAPSAPPARWLPTPSAKKR